MSYRHSKSNYSVFAYLFCLIVIVAIFNKLNNYLTNLNNSHIFLVFIFILFLILILLLGFKKYTVNNKYKLIQLNEIDTMTGIQFEEYLCHYFRKTGYTANMTPKSNDYGADIVLYKNSCCTVIQVKRYNSKVGIKAVQEVLAAMSYYHAQNGIVITNNYYTSQAINLARMGNIQLWDRDTLKEKVIYQK